MSFIRTIPIQQITPLIHFQWEQGAPCLRATELKPRIQHFITHHFKEVNAPRFQQHIKAVKKFAPSKDGQALPSPYRLDVIPNSAPQWYLPVAGKYQQTDAGSITTLPGFGKLKGMANSPYFANAEPLKPNGDKSALRLAVMYREPLSLRISGFDPEVLDLVEIALPFVLAYHNFGTRKSKGFGCFLPVGTTEKSLESLLFSCPDFVAIRKKKANYSSPDQWLAAINREYKHLKNQPDPDEGNLSLLKDYFKDAGIEWEKEFVSQYLGQHKTSGKTGQVPPPDDLRYVRALLGLAELYDYPRLEDARGRTYKSKVDIASHPNKDAIERFASPLLMKPGPGVLFLAARPIETQLFDQVFKFTGEHAHALISTPSSTDFDWTDFFSTLSNWQHVK